MVDQSMSWSHLWKEQRTTQVCEELTEAQGEQEPAEALFFDGAAVANMLPQNPQDIWRLCQH